MVLCITNVRNPCGTRRLFRQRFSADTPKQPGRQSCSRVRDPAPTYSLQSTVCAAASLNHQPVSLPGARAQHTFGCGQRPRWGACNSLPGHRLRELLSCSCCQAVVSPWFGFAIRRAAAVIMGEGRRRLPGRLLGHRSFVTTVRSSSGTAPGRFDRSRVPRHQPQPTRSQDRRAFNTSSWGPPSSRFRSPRSSIGCVLYVRQVQFTGALARISGWFQSWAAP